MKQFVSAMFMLMAGAVFADAVSVAALDAKIRGMMDENMTVGMSVVVVKGDKVNGMHGIRKCLHGVFNLLHENFIRQ